MTLNQIINKVLKPLAEDHLQLSDFGFGDLSNISTTTSVKYPVMWAVLRSTSFSGNYYSHQFSLVFADLVNNDLSNALEIQSDMIQVGADIAAKLSERDDDVEIANDFQFTPFIDRFSDLAAGVVMDIRIKTAKTLNGCEFPSKSSY